MFICLYINVKIGFADKYYRFRSVNYNLHTLVVVNIVSNREIYGKIIKYKRKLYNTNGKLKNTNLRIIENK